MIPHEHGAWMMFYAPMVVGAAHGGSWQFDLLALFLFATGGFCYREPLGVLFSKRVKAHPAAWKWLAGFSLLSFVGALGLLKNPHLPELAILVVVGVGIFGIHFFLARRREHRGFWGELLGVSGLTLTAPLAYFTAGGAAWSHALTLWTVHVLFFASSIVYVKWRVQGMLAQKRETRSTSGLAALIGYHAVMVTMLMAVVFWNLLSAMAFVAFLPLGLRYFLPFLVRRTPTLTQVGITEIVLSLTFVAVMVWGL
jgi:hypothetical protein